MYFNHVLSKHSVAMADWRNTVWRNNNNNNNNNNVILVQFDSLREQIKFLFASDQDKI